MVEERFQYVDWKAKFLKYYKTKITHFFIFWNLIFQIFWKKLYKLQIWLNLNVKQCMKPSKWISNLNTIMVSKLKRREKKINLWKYIKSFLMENHWKKWYCNYSYLCLIFSCGYSTKLRQILWHFITFFLRECKGYKWLLKFQLIFMKVFHFYFQLILKWYLKWIGEN